MGGRGGLARWDFRLLWVGETSSKLGSAVTTVALPLVAVTHLNATTLQVALLEAAVWLPWLVVGLPAGALVDRWPSKPLMLLCNAVSATLLISVPVAVLFDALTMTQLTGVAFFAAVATVFFSTAYQRFLPAVVDTPDLPAANARMQGSESAAQVAGPSLGGLLAGAFGAATGLLADAVTFVVSSVCLLRIRSVQPRPEPVAKRSIVREIGEGLRYLVHDPYLRVIAAFSAATNLAGGMLQAVLVVFLVRSVGISEWTVGTFLSLVSLGGIAGAMAATWVSRRFGSARGLIICELCTAPFALLIPLTGPGAGLAFLVAGGVMTTAGVIAFNVIFGAFRAAYVPRHLLGRIVASTRFVNYGTLPVGAVLGGVLGTSLGLPATLWISAAGTAGAVLILFLGPIRTRRDLPVAAGELSGVRS
ncbi:Predicted arabinose efflux permease, MFS family [Actinokineospora alba]|uniref:Predicted arabinose efflux permease, MFS family n=1 Tax=Actinokineospora alba TaxID=504798 RepID=A0A1H0NJK0_9PSEU|nr:MFS transporter [Actinokineospora alba]TDP68743.1 putative MFS family arabinose efflux permease [Actinokineospora alba]SDH85727.1 Predicted arabinose efflux permease, MFS family [Actinokineospora alba]SDO92829.1 Predicted arabinose efflux permease, MFS family [Actinokineospora alba]